MHSRYLPNWFIDKSGERKHVPQSVETISMKTIEKKKGQLKKKVEVDSEYQPILIYHHTKGKKFL